MQNREYFRIINESSSAGDIRTEFVKISYSGEEPVLEIRRRARHTGGGVSEVILTFTPAECRKLAEIIGEVENE